MRRHRFPRDTPMPARPLRARAFAALVALALGVGCARGGADDGHLTVAWRLPPQHPAVGREAVGTVTLTTAAAEPVPGAILDIEAHMSHPGMAPVVARATEQAPGVYQAHLAFTMAGDWIVVVSGTLADGRPVRQRAAELTVALPQ